MNEAQKKHIWDSLSELKDGHRDILRILQTDHKMDEIGLIKEVHTNTKDISEIKLERKVFLGKISVVSLFLGGIGGIIIWIIKMVWK